MYAVTMNFLTLTSSAFQQGSTVTLVDAECDCQTYVCGKVANNSLYKGTLQ